MIEELTLEEIVADDISSMGAFITVCARCYSALQRSCSKPVTLLS